MAFSRETEVAVRIVHFLRSDCGFAPGQRQIVLNALDQAREWFATNWPDNSATEESWKRFLTAREKSLEC